MLPICRLSGSGRLRLSATVAVFAMPLLGAAQPAQPPTPSANECASLLRQAQDPAQLRRMTKEQLDRASVCLDMLKQRPNAQNAPLKIFRN